MPKTLTRRLAVVLAVSLIVCVLASADFLPRMKLWELVDESDAIVVGKVIDVNSYWNLVTDEIYTYVDLEVDSVLKGSGIGSQLIVRQMGGTIDSISEYVSGSSSWAIEERVLAFLAPHPADADAYMVVNLSQGKISILEDQDGQEILLWPFFDDYVGTVPGDSLAPVFNGEIQTLSDMIADIDSLLGP
jgi:hypothetical protein